MDHDTSWLHLLPSLAPKSAVCIGRLDDEVAALEQRSVSVTTVDAATDPSVVISGEAPELVILAEPQHIETWLPIINTASAAVVAVRFRGVLARFVAHRLLPRLESMGDWHVVPVRRPRSIWARRATRARRLASARLRSRIPTSSWRSHGSDAAAIRPQRAAKDWRTPHGVLVRGLEDGLPAYLRSITAQHGIDTSSRPWSMMPARGFRSQKVLFRVEPTPSEPGFVIKTTQSPEFNDRLLAEARALEALAGPSKTSNIMVADPIFTDFHAGMAIHSQSLLDGVGFRHAADPDHGSRHLWAAAIGLTELAASTRQGQPPSAIESGLAEVVARHAGIFGTPVSIVRELERSVAKVAASLQTSVFSHGDLGVWNLRVLSDGSIGILDWENADPAGLPLWDLFELFRTFGVFLADAEGVRYSESVFREQLLSGSALRTIMSKALQEYCTRLDVPTDVVDDLFTLCWVHNANREAATMANPVWPGGRNNAYLRNALRIPFAFAR